jgi:hypothetical protein
MLLVLLPSSDGLGRNDTHSWGLWLSKSNDGMEGLVGGAEGMSEVGGDE